MLDIRDNDEHIAFKVTITIATTYYHKEQDEVIIYGMIQGQGMLWQNTTEGKTSLILIPREKLSQVLHDVHYTEILKFEIPLYSDSSSVTNDAVKKTLPLLRHTAALLKQGNNEGALYDDWINKSPTVVTAIYEDILLRIQVVQL